MPEIPAGLGFRGKVPGVEEGSDGFGSLEESFRKEEVSFLDVLSLRTGRRRGRGVEGGGWGEGGGLSQGWG
jgi:hypothetical protein